MPDVPTFAAWSHENLAKFATDMYLQNQALEEANALLRRDVKDALDLIRFVYREQDDML